jgi:hypothetical protein
MHPNAPKLLEDIRDAAAFVVDSVRGLAQAEYEENRLLRQAVERNFEIIGEALIRLTQVDEPTAEQAGPVGQIKAFRNILSTPTRTSTTPSSGTSSRRSCPPCFKVSSACSPKPKQPRRKRPTRISRRRRRPRSRKVRNARVTDVRSHHRPLESMARRLFRSWFVDFDPVHTKAALRRQHPKLSNADLSRRALPNLDPKIAELFPDDCEDSTLGPIPKGWRAGTVPDAIEVNPSRSIAKGTIVQWLEMANMPTRSARALTPEPPF